jgi:hypothetical protein
MPGLLTSKVMRVGSTGLGRFLYHSQPNQPPAASATTPTSSPADCSGLRLTKAPVAGTQPGADQDTLPISGRSSSAIT